MNVASLAAGIASSGTSARLAGPYKFSWPCACSLSTSRHGDTHGSTSHAEWCHSCRNTASNDMRGPVILSSRLTICACYASSEGTRCDKRWPLWRSTYLSRQRRLRRISARQGHDKRAEGCRSRARESAALRRPMDHHRPRACVVSSRDRRSTVPCGGRGHVSCTATASTAVCQAHAPALPRDNLLAGASCRLGGRGKGRALSSGRHVHAVDYCGETHHDACCSWAGNGRRRPH